MGIWVSTYGGDMLVSDTFSVRWSAEESGKRQNMLELKMEENKWNDNLWEEAD